METTEHPILTEIRSRATLLDRLTIISKLRRLARSYDIADITSILTISASLTKQDLVLAAELLTKLEHILTPNEVA